MITIYLRQGDWRGSLLPFRAGSAIAQRLIAARQAGKCPAMTPVFDIGDRARLPWRFHGQTRTATARL
ncbi:hypothetical protein E2L05_07385 [Meridianimarinicoccus aquatilis]|uniref:Uncharacterized protein n=1 Tax=Meridianimarinicoccus aquatilis TaxID=2552766 RepID=A0A4R6AZF3_9RHOB|nr:hypothetical protein E2L05_07385 [Fluviibacterium aquatile]